MLPLEDLVNFLRKIADQIEQGTLPENQIQFATEHFLAHTFSLSKPLPEEEAKKYLALGWYIYTQLHD